MSMTVCHHIYHCEFVDENKDFFLEMSEFKQPYLLNQVRYFFLNFQDFSELFSNNTRMNIEINY